MDDDDEIRLPQIKIAAIHTHTGEGRSAAVHR